METERWRPVSGYAGLYDVSDLGRVLHVPTGKMVSQHVNLAGYKTVVLSGNGRRKRMLAHRIVAAEFVMADGARSQVNHLNGVRSDNRAENLEWVTHQENMAHASASGRMGVGAHNAAKVSYYHLEKLNMPTESLSGLLAVSAKMEPPATPTQLALAVLVRAARMDARDLSVWLNEPERAKGGKAGGK